jgi:GH25 family lysozyme M1 (1,4-beta-N-acetylmuramidase)
VKRQSKTAFVYDTNIIKSGVGNMKRTNDKRSRQTRALKMAWSIFLVICVVFALVVVLNTDRVKGEELDPDIFNQTDSMKPGLLAEMVEDNYLSYIHKSYILIGNYPDCQYIKISANVPRNDYDVENFYIEDDSEFMNYYVDGVKTARTAIDVSSYQGSINWSKVKAAGVDVAMIRLGYRGYGQGDLTTDKNYVTNVNGASAAGLEVGVYFFTQAISYEEGVEEANYVLQNIAGKNITQPIVIDTEYVYSDTEARANDIDNTARTDAIVGFCETIKNAGYTPMIYGSRNWFAQNLDVDRLADYEWWLAYYANQPNFPYHYSGWQYTSEGSLVGVSSEYVDLNVWFR